MSTDRCLPLPADLLVDICVVPNSLSIDQDQETSATAIIFLLSTRTFLP
jgi:hypothetical protein